MTDLKMVVMPVRGSARRTKERNQRLLLSSLFSCLYLQMRTELYFLSSQKNRPSLFGMPLIVPCTVHTRKKDLYDAVWIQVSRLASPLPPQEASNHAQDWWVSGHLPRSTVSKCRKRRSYVNSGWFIGLTTIQPFICSGFLSRRDATPSFHHLDIPESYNPYNLLPKSFWQVL